MKRLIRLKGLLIGLGPDEDKSYISDNSLLLTSITLSGVFNQASPNFRRIKKDYSCKQGFKSS